MPELGQGRAARGRPRPALGLELSPLYEPLAGDRSPVAALLGSVVAVGHLWLSRSEPDVQPTTSQLRRLARAALEQQGVPVGRLRWMGEHSNHLFRCDTASGERLLLRVCLPDGRSDAELDSELAWLAALARDTDLTVPVARFSTRVATADLPAGGRCIAFTWLQGRHCEQRPSRRLVADLGRVLATLHAHARRFRPPAGFTRPTLDIHYLTWTDSWHAAQLTRRPIDPATRRLLDEVAGRVQAALAQLGTDPAVHGLVHADLHLGNVLDHHGQARPLDFDDAAWGHYALDLAIAVDSVPEPLHPVLLGGYRAVRPLPDGYQQHVAALLAGRRLFLATFLLAHGLPVVAHLDLLRAFIAS
jgi:Ser/Thr protein kinase RdoA (MazF antagonist)